MSDLSEVWPYRNGSSPERHATYRRFPNEFDEAIQKPIALETLSAKIESAKPYLDGFSDVDTTLKIKNAVIEGDLTDRDFEKSHFENVTFRGADLTGANFNGAVLRGVRFEKCILDHATFVDAQLRYSEMPETSMEYADFRNARLECSDFRKVNARNATFRNANTDMTDFSGSDFTHSKLSDMTFWRSKLSDIRVQNARVANIEGDVSVKALLQAGAVNKGRSLTDQISDMVAEQIESRQLFGTLDRGYAI